MSDRSPRSGDSAAGNGPVIQPAAAGHSSALRAPLPSFVGIGMMKAGTTLVHALFEANQATTVPRWNKEVSFFDLHHERGMDWYRQHFALPSDPAGAVWGDLTPGYILSDTARANIGALGNEPVLIVCLRDPYARLRSQFHHDRATLGGRNDPARYLHEDYNQVVTRSCYSTLLAPWLRDFGPERFHYVILEDYQARPLAVATDLFDRLGVAPLPGEQLETIGRVNEAVTPRNRFLSAVAHRTQLLLRRSGRFAAASALAGNERLRSLILSDRRPDNDDFCIPDEVRRRIERDLDALDQVTGRSITSIWSETGGS
jgi:hypothetical protein